MIKGKRTSLSIRLGLPVVLWSICGFSGAKCEDTNETGNSDESDPSPDDSDTARHNEVPSDTNTDQAEELEALCVAAATVDVCEAIEGCGAILGRKTDLARDCLNAERTYLYCTSSMVCDDAPGYALDPETGECYNFSVYCFPPGWTVVDGDHVNCTLSSYDTCFDTKEAN